MKEKKKILFYCDNPACFAHYVANKKLKVKKLSDSVKGETE